MTDMIAPALTPEEWRLQCVTCDTDDFDYCRLHGGELHCANRAGQFVVIPVDKLGAMMALANDALPDDDPRKITREDVVDELDAYHAAVIFARWCEDNGMPDKRIEAKERAARHSRRAAKLAALLPPAT